ncbi:hypothetical protein L13192_03743 [Pyrenophora tritici-repentis]|uniref:Uncharacterized protein n=1 Tax=Pyrenophora tritici-repentis TaxID=45151 RepID=A0A922NG32_9PLEO|nr:hypothetical protein Ptr86124_006258 [Pyrenophora tritici-repentis]KAI1672884.1 hypothetical protein L13192_03743 [Pyrenophora tritici-repentis]KAI1677316.1 hypothetical protein KJE20_13405 [Pyrenophora tritici-repentis]
MHTPAPVQPALDPALTPPTTKDANDLSSSTHTGLTPETHAWDDEKKK